MMFCLLQKKKILLLLLSGGNKHIAVYSTPCSLLGWTHGWHFTAASENKFKVMQCFCCASDRAAGPTELERVLLITVYNVALYYIAVLRCGLSFVV